MRIGLVFVLLAVISTHAAGESLTLYTGALSQHYQELPADKVPMETNHKLVAVQYGSLMAGYMENSYHRDTVFVGGIKEWRLLRHVKGAVTVGANYGYTDCTNGAKDEQHLYPKKVCGYILGAVYYDEYLLQPGVLISFTYVALSVRWEFDKL